MIYCPLKNITSNFHTSNEKFIFQLPISHSYPRKNRLANGPVLPDSEQKCSRMNKQSEDREVMWVDMTHLVQSVETILMSPALVEEVQHEVALDDGI